MVARASDVYDGGSAQGVAQHDRCGQQDDGAGLMRGSERDRHDQQQGRDAERYLHRCCGEQCPQSDAGGGGEGGAKAGGPQQQHRGGGRHRQQAMVELDRGNVFEPVADEGVELGVAGRDQPSVHQRKGVVSEPGAGAGDKPAGGDCQPDEQDHGLGGSPPQESSLSAPGGGEGRGEVGEPGAIVGVRLTLPLRCPLPRPAEGRRGK